MFGAILFSIGAAIVQVAVGVLAVIGLFIDVIRFGAKAVFELMARPVARFG